MIEPMRAVTVGLGVAGLVLASVAPAAARPSDPGVVSYAVMPKGSVSNIVGAPIRWESEFTAPFQAFSVDNPVCNNWADIGLPEVFNDPDLASFGGATAQTAAGDATHLVKQAVGVFATVDAADRAYHRVVDRTVGCAGQTTAMHLDNFHTEVWTFTGGPAGRRARPTPTGSSRRRAPTGGVSTPPGSAKTFCCRQKCANPATEAPRSTCWPGPCRTPWGNNRPATVTDLSRIKTRTLSV